MLAFLISLSLVSSLKAATTLKDAFEAARLNMENIKSADAVLRQKIERKNQAMAVAMPNVSGVGFHTWIDRPDARPGVNPAFILTKQYSGAIRMVQPILRGGILAAYQLAKEDILLAQFQKDGTELSLYQLIIPAYYNVYASQLDLKILGEAVKANQERVRELEKFSNLGRSRKGELAQAQSQLYTAEALLQSAQQNLKVTEEIYFFYTGQDPKDLAPLQDVPKELASLNEYMDKLKKRPDILAKYQAIQVADRQVEVAKGGHYPSLDFVGNYYLTRTGVLQTSNWDVGLQVTLPLFQGGGVSALVRENVEKKRVVELDASQTRRSAERDLATLYQNHYQIQERLTTLKNALKKAEEAYKLNQRDYRFGQNTNLEVIQALNLYVETKRTYSALLSVAVATYKNIEAATGILP